MVVPDGGAGVGEVVGVVVGGAGGDGSLLLKSIQGKVLLKEKPNGVRHCAWRGRIESRRACGARG